MRLTPDFVLGVLTVWGESRGEPDAGKVAVGEVIRNRMKKEGKTTAAIVLAPVQFSCWWWKDPNFIKMHLLEDTDPAVRACANAWLASETTNLVDGATHYCNLDVVHPPWVDEMEMVVTIGHHTFFRTRRA